MSVLPLEEIRPGDVGRAGRKATTLAELVRAGFAVPPGFVVPVDAFEPDGALRQSARASVLEAARLLGAPSLAVRSSALAEDLADASYAGQYLTMLEIPSTESLLDAVRRVHASGRRSDSGYRAPSSEVAVLVQPMLDARAAGVAFTADPVTGDRRTIVINAVRGIGERLVSGRSNADEWRVRGDTIERRGVGDPSIEAEEARAVADIARRIAELRGAPHDIEWAIERGTVFVLQARPMTALPDDLRWVAPPGAWARHFRLGEWIGDPVTPLFESWLLTTMEETMHGEYSRIVGQPAPRPLHAVVNGWYFYSLNFLPASAGAVARMLPGMLVRLPRDARRIAAVFPPTARFGVDVFIAEWRDALLPAYLSAAERADEEVARAAPDRLVRIIDELAVLAGRYFTSITFVAGYGWKTEIPLAQFYRLHLADKLGGHVQLLLRGLVRASTPSHAVLSLDWSFPTLGEMERIPPDTDADARYARLSREREDLERHAHELLSPQLAARFDRLLAEAQRAAVLREEQVLELTRPWPVFRRALARIGESLVAQGVIAAPEDVYFLERGELLSAPTDHRPLVAERRARWERQRRLVAPLVIGQLPRMLTTLLGAADRALRDPAASADGVLGTPASPGRATGRARVLRSAAEFDRLGQGEVLVCPVTAPSWTPLFARAAAVVTDIGSPSAHASLIAREYGIPAVVGTGDGTTRITDGSLVTVDGGAGLVVLAER